MQDILARHAVILKQHALHLEICYISLDDYRVSLYSEYCRWNNLSCVQTIMRSAQAVWMCGYREISNVQHAALPLIQPIPSRKLQVNRLILNLWISYWSLDCISVHYMNTIFVYTLFWHYNKFSTGGVSHSPDEKDKMSNPELRKARFDLLFKEYEVKMNMQ